MGEVIKIKENGRGAEKVDAESNKLLQEKFGHDQETLKKMKEEFPKQVAKLNAILANTDLSPTTLQLKKEAKKSIEEINTLAENANNPERLVALAKKILSASILAESTLVTKDGKVSLISNEKIKTMNTLDPEKEKEKNKIEKEKQEKGAKIDATNTKIYEAHFKSEPNPNPVPEKTNVATTKTESDFDKGIRAFKEGKTGIGALNQ